MGVRNTSHWVGFQHRLVTRLDTEPCCKVWKRRIFCNQGAYDTSWEGVFSYSSGLHHNSLQVIVFLFVPFTVSISTTRMKKMMVGGHSRGLPNFVPETHVELPPSRSSPPALLSYLGAGLSAPSCFPQAPPRPLVGCGVGGSFLPSPLAAQGEVRFPAPHWSALRDNSSQPPSTCHFRVRWLQCVCWGPGARMLGGW